MTNLAKSGLNGNSYKHWLSNTTLPDFIENPEPRKKTLQNEYANWLESQNWDFYCTFTTNYELTLKSARRIMIKLHDTLNKNHSRSRFFWVAEPFDCKEGFHTHALLHFNDRDYQNISISGNSLDFELLRKAWLKCNPKKSNAYCKLERFKKSRGATSYVGKYMNKHRSDYDLLI